MSERPDRPFVRWVLATWLGWILGIVAVVALSMVADAVGLAGVQTGVGVGAGLGVGLVQARWFAQRGGPSRAWFRSCVGGLGGTFLVVDLFAHGVPAFGYSLYVAVVLGGVVTGVWQARILRAFAGCATGWVAVSVVGWSGAAAAVAVADWVSRERIWNGFAALFGFLGILACGGLILGLVTGMRLAPLVRVRG